MIFWFGLKVEHSNAYFTWIPTCICMILRHNLWSIYQREMFWRKVIDSIETCYVLHVSVSITGFEIKEDGEHTRIIMLPCCLRPSEFVSLLAFLSILLFSPMIFLLFATVCVRLWPSSGSWDIFGSHVESTCLEFSMWYQFVLHMCWCSKYVYLLAMKLCTGMTSVITVGSLTGNRVTFTHFVCTALMYLGIGPASYQYR